MVVKNDRQHIISNPDSPYVGIRACRDNLRRIRVRIKTDLRNCDCMDLMKEFPDKYFELAIVDPPYGINYDILQNKCAETRRTQNGGAWKKYKQTEWDKNIPDEYYFQELFRVSQNQIIWGANFYNNTPSSCWIVWDKIQRDNRSDGEMAWTSFKKPFKIFRYSRADAYINQCDNKIHPTQKPVALYKWLLEHYAKKGDKILDTHLGSMSSVIACFEMGYDITGSELDADYYKAGIDRVNKHTSQLRFDDFIEERI